MTLAVAFKGPEGLVLAADSRITITATDAATGQQYTSYFDNATKLFGIDGQPHVGVVTYGNTIIGTTNLRTVHGFMPEFEAKLARSAGDEPQRMRVVDIARELATFYAEHWRAAAMPTEATPVWFKVAGFDDGEAYGRIHEVQIPDQLEPTEYYPGATFGVRWGGQSELAERWLNGVDPRAATLAQTQLGLTDEQVGGLKQKWSEQLPLPIPWQFLPLQDCVDLAAFLVTMTSVSQTWTYVGVRGVGGQAEVATITRNGGFRPIRSKLIQVRDWQ
jgi:hypothetical protein